jgi:hypothetical protein
MLYTFIRLKNNPIEIVFYSDIEKLKHFFIKSAVWGLSLQLIR